MYEILYVYVCMRTRDDGSNVYKFEDDDESIHTARMCMEYVDMCVCVFVFMCVCVLSLVERVGTKDIQASQVCRMDSWR